MNAKFRTKFVSTLAAGALALTALIPNAPAFAQGGIEATLSDLSTTQYVVVTVNNPGPYKINREGNNPSEVLTVTASNGELQIDLGGKTSWQFQGGICPTDNSRVWVKITDDCWWGLDSTATTTGQTNASAQPTPIAEATPVVVTNADETVVQTGEGNLSGPAKGTLLMAKLNGTYSSMAEEIDTALLMGCPAESGQCYRYTSDGGIVFTGSSDFTDHMVQEGKFLDMAREGMRIYFRLDGEAYLEAVRFDLTRLEDNKSVRYSVDTRVHLTSGHYYYTNAQNTFNPGFRLANVSQLEWLNSPINQPFEAILYTDFDSGNTMNREGFFVQPGTVQNGAENTTAVDNTGVGDPDPKPTAFPTEPAAATSDGRQIVPVPMPTLLETLAGLALIIGVIALIRSFRPAPQPAAPNTPIINNVIDADSDARKPASS